MSNSKSYDEYVLGLYDAMLKDIVSRCPGLRTECERDYKRLLSAINQMGLPFVLEVLPAFGKHLDQCLANGLLTPSHLAHFRPYNRRVAIPRLFKGLLLRVFDVNGVLRSDPDVQSIRDVRQLSLAFKRFRVNCPEPKVWKQIDEFFKTDSEVIVGSLNWDFGDFDSDGVRDLQFGDHVPSESDSVLPLFGGSESTTSNIHPDAAAAIQFTADAICAELGGFNPFDWKSRHGPGAVADLRTGEYKYSFPTWPSKLDASFPIADFAFANYGEWADAEASGMFDGRFLDHEPPARLLAVPKTFSGPRLICSEPTSGQWCQQIIRDFLMRRVRDTSFSSAIRFDSQDRNQDLALAASLHESHSTIDLSSASDRISCWVVERLFRLRPELLECMYSVRTRSVTQSIDRKSPQTSRLRKFSTMGSALTFPVQTYLFTTLVVGTILATRGWDHSFRSIRRAAREVRVFGDDLIVPIDCHDNVVDTLTHFRLKVNSAKTFRNGKFRESCGVEAYDGNDITKVSFLSVPLVSKPASVLSCIDTHNNLLSAGWYATAIHVKKTVDRLKRYSFRWVDQKSGLIGWHSLFGESNHHLRRRWNEELQRVEVRTCCPTSGPGRTPSDRGSMLLQYFTEAMYPPVSREIRLGVAALKSPLKLRWRWVPV